MASETPSFKKLDNVQSPKKGDCVSVQSLFWSDDCIQLAAQGRPRKLKLLFICVLSEDSSKGNDKLFIVCCILTDIWTFLYINSRLA